MLTKMIKAYIAGPDVFRGNAHHHFEVLKNKCLAHNIAPLVPLDNEIEVDLSNSVKKLRSATKIYEANIDMIHAADIVIANISPFRGPQMDPGTAFEIGFAVALGKPVYLYSDEHLTDYADRVESYGAYSEDFLVVEDFGLNENLMICIPGIGLYPSIDKILEHIKKEGVA